MDAADTVARRLRRLVLPRHGEAHGRGGSEHGVGVRRPQRDLHGGRRLRGAHLRGAPRPPRRCSSAIGGVHLVHLHPSGAPGAPVHRHRQLERRGRAIGRGDARRAKLRQRLDLRAARQGARLVRVREGRSLRDVHRRVSASAGEARSAIPTSSPSRLAPSCRWHSHSPARAPRRRCTPSSIGVLGLSLDDRRPQWVARRAARRPHCLRRLLRAAIRLEGSHRRLQSSRSPCCSSADAKARRPSRRRSSDSISSTRAWT